MKWLIPLVIDIVLFYFVCWLMPVWFNFSWQYWWGFPTWVLMGLLICAIGSIIWPLVDSWNI